MKFGEAFKAARSAGKKTFKWQGKTYHTKTKEEMEKTKKSVPTPTPRPSQNSGPRSSSVDAENAKPKAGPKPQAKSSSVSAENAKPTKPAAAPAKAAAKSERPTPAADRFVGAVVEGAKNLFSRKVQRTKVGKYAR